MINFQIKPKNQNFITQKRLKHKIQQNPEIKNGKKGKVDHMKQIKKL